MKTIKEIWLSILILVSSVTVFAVFLPFFPIDETRYLTVAWEMKLNNSFLVPLLNNLSYSHKPPFLFWLINADWFLFGINEKTLRYIPLLFSVFNLVLVYRIALILWEDKKIAQYATLILASMQIYLCFSALIMFDILLTFWVLLGIFGLLLVTKKDKSASWLVVSLSVGGGLVTKGPVIFLHIIPVTFFCFLWMRRNKVFRLKFLIGIFLSILTGAAIALLWAIPAEMIGGDKYKSAILWGQTINRIVSSFSHKHSLWFYIPLLPVLFFPWTLVKPGWMGFASVRKDANAQLLIVWIVSTIVLFSLISAKQIYYLVPMLPAVSILLAKNMAGQSRNIETHHRWHFPVSICYIVLGILTLLSLTLSVHLGKDLNWISFDLILTIAIGMAALGILMLFIRSTSMDTMIKIISVSSAVFIIFLVPISGKSIHHQLDVHDMARVLKEKQDEGYEIVTFKNYHGQYQFLGRLMKPIIRIKNKKSFRKFMGTHQKVLFITNEDPGKVINENKVVYQRSYRGKKAVLWNDKAIHYLIDRLRG